MNERDKQQGIEAAARARAEVYETLEQLQYKLNFPQRIDDAVDDAKMRIAEKKAKNPVGFAAAVAGVAVVAGLAVWGIATVIARRLQ